ncbi:MAG: Dabb family protein [Ferruginibacter sp.]
MNFKEIKFGEDKPFAHMFFFQLSDTSKELVQDFITLCVEYLSHHPGQEHFSVGWRAVEISRNVSATNFDVSIHMIFTNIKAYEDYSKSDRHDDFITHSAGMSPSRVVFDSFLNVSVVPEK